MKNKSLLVFAILFMAIQGFSQVKPFRFGVKVAPSISWMSPDSKTYESDGSLLGFAWGFMADISLTENYFVATGFNLDYLNSKLQYPHFTSLDDNGGDPVQGVLQRKYNLRYLELPLKLKMRTNQFNKKSFFGEVGFGTGFNIKARAKDNFSYDNGQSSLKTESDIKNEIVFMKSSLLVGAGMEYFVDESTSINISLSFSNGLSDILKGENTLDPTITQKAYLYSFQLNIGVLF